MDFKRTLPASWYTSEPLYSLEKRAVFQKSWYLLGPLPMFYQEAAAEEGLHFEIAQTPLTVRRTSDEDMRSLIVTSDASGAVLKSHITKTGLLFTTISEQAPEFAEFFPELEELLSRVDFTRRPHRRSIKYDGGFNWKTMVDGYQECLHCQYTHPSFSTLYPPTFYKVHNHHNFSRHIADPQKPDDGLFLHFFPICTLNVYGGGMSIFRVCPLPEPGRSRMEFDYFHLEEGEKFEEYFSFVRQVAMEDYELCEVAQANLERGVYGEGVLNPEKESGVAHYQQKVLELVTKQYELENKRSEKVALANDHMKLPAQPTVVVG